MHSLSHAELRKLGVMMENFIGLRAKGFGVLAAGLVQTLPDCSTRLVLSNLRPKLLRNGNAPAHAERARRNF